MNAAQATRFNRPLLLLMAAGILATAALVIASIDAARSGRLLAGGRGDQPAATEHCQRNVEAILRTRTIRFDEGSAALDPASRELLDEVAAALRPCTGGRIAITGHTDARGDETANVALSLDRARTVREALVARGIPRTDLRARGLGSSVPVSGLDPSDPANRRIEFAVLTPARLVPTPVDTAAAP